MSWSQGPQGVSGLTHNSMATRLVARVVVGAPILSVSVADIPQHYANLSVLFQSSAEGGAVTDVQLNINDDSGAAKYAYGRILRTTGAASSGGSASATTMLVGYSPGASDTIFGPTRIWLPAYASQIFEKSASFQSIAYNSAPAVSFQFGGGVWFDLSPVRKLTFTNSGGTNWRRGTTISVYGEP